jgi:hypothetical protein
MNNEQGRMNNGGGGILPYWSYGLLFGFQRKKE